MLKGTKNNLKNDSTASSDKKFDEEISLSESQPTILGKRVSANGGDDNTVVLTSEVVHSTSSKSSSPIKKNNTTPSRNIENQTVNSRPPSRSNSNFVAKNQPSLVNSDATIVVNKNNDVLPDLNKTIISESAQSPKTYERKPLGSLPKAHTSGGKPSRVIRNRFELKNLLGEGGMGSVWRAVDRRKIEANDLNPYVAVKLLNDDFKKHPDAFISLQRETQKSQTLAHPNIVTVYDFDRDGETVFMTMEYLQGAPLDKLLRDTSGTGLEHAQAIGIIKDISSALIYAHSHGIIHSDFKPGNIFVSDSGLAKVLDFGIARVAAESAGSTSEQTKPISDKFDGDDTSKVTTTNRTQDTYDAGTLSALTPAYASYEMFERQAPDPSDDVYALACVAYEMLTGRHPYDRKPANKKNLPVLQRIKFLTRDQWQALEKALKIRRAERTATVDEFVAQFFKKRTNPLVYFAAATVIGLLGGGVYYQVQKREAELVESARIREQAAVEKQKFESVQQQLERRFTQQELDRSVLRDDWKEESELLFTEYAAFNNHDPLLIESYRSAASDKFLSLAEEKLKVGDLSDADLIIASESVDLAGVYIAESRYWSISNTNIDSVVGLKAIVEQRISNEGFSRQQAEEQRLLAIKRRDERIQREATAREYQRQLTVDRTNLFKGFECHQDLDVAGVPASTLNAFRSKYPKEVSSVEETLVNRSSFCVQQVAKRNPIKANRILTASSIVFPAYANDLNKIVIDYCGHVRTGSGRPCRDPSSANGRPPLMVVVPSANDIDVKLAFSRYEVSNKDFSYFCNSTGKCNVDENALPVTGLNLDLIASYINWLSQITGFQYRLPSIEEWQAAARGRDEVEDPNRNCYLRFNGIVKGESLVTVDTGTGNDYGLVNHSGNAQEIVKSGSDYKIVGGSIKDPMSRCTVDTVKDYKGTVDSLTGFRVVRLVN